MFVTQTVLLVDDQHPVREQLHGILRSSGYLVVESRNVDDALEKFERYHPEAVIIDLTLPGTIDALVAIRTMNRSPFQPTILAMGSASQSPLLMESLTMGAVDFLTKPLQDRSVRLCLQRNLG